MSPEALPYPLESRRSLSEIVCGVVPWTLLEGFRNAFDRLTGERQRIELEQRSLELSLGPEAPPNLRVGLLADFHWDPLHEAGFVGRCVETINREEVDLVLLLGDFVSYSFERVDELTGLLGQIESGGGTFAILGNHDHIAGAGRVEASLAAQGIPVLRNELREVDLGGGRLFLAGVESALRSCPDFRVLDGVPAGAKALLMAHEPDVFRHSRDHRATALQVSGHTHGGQISLPVVGPPLLPSLGRKYVQGHHEGEEAQLYVSRGIGTGHVHVRWNAPPEITVLEIANGSLDQGG